MPPKQSVTLREEIVAELIGTAMMVFFGVGSVHVAVLTGALIGLWQVAVVWGLGVGLSIYATASISGAHLNPAVTIAFATLGRCSWKKVLPFIVSQLFGAILAAIILYAFFSGFLAKFEQEKSIVRGESGSELSAMTYGEYFPNPGMIGVDEKAKSLVPYWSAMLAEALGTGILVFVIFALTDSRNENRPGAGGIAFCIGFTVTAIICILAPITQAGLNPARDFGPRIVAYFLGWGKVAIPGPRGGFFDVYILAPIVGAIIGAAVHQFVLRPPERKAMGRPESAAVD